MPLSAGSRLGPYEILAPLGAGGMGEVYRARDTRLGREVAVKVLPASFAADPDRLRRFELEARTTGMLNHPNILAVYDIGTHNGAPYLVTELLEGATLREQLPAPRRKALDFARQACQGLAAAHAKGVTHRDLKPENLFVTNDGRVKILDFGLAKVAAEDTEVTQTERTAPGMAMGTVGYMSPEQARGKPADPRSDLFSLGVILYEMASGQRAFQRDSSVETLNAILKEDPPPLEDAALERIVRRCLEKTPEQRFQSASDLGFALESMSSTVATSGAARMPDRPNARRWVMVSVALAACLAAGLAAGLWIHARQDAAAPGWTGVQLGGSSIAFTPRISPDGRTLAFVAMVDDLTQVAVMNPASGHWTILTRDRSQGAVTNLCWSRDGANIYFDRLYGVPRGVFQIPALGGEERLILEDATHPEILADGSLLVVRIGAGRNLQLHRYWPESGRLQALGALFWNPWVSPFRVSPDSREVVFFGQPVLASKGGGQPPVPSAGPAHLYALDINSGRTRRLAPELRWDLRGSTVLPLAITPDGRSVLTAVGVGDSHRVVAIPRNGSGPAQTLLSFTSLVWYLDVGSDGSLYLDQVERPYDVLRFSVSGGSPERLASSTSNSSYGPLQFPDGRILLPSLFSGRNRLLLARPAKDPVPFAATEEETSPPMARLGEREVVFLAGTGADRSLAISSLADGRIVRRFSPTKGLPITSLAASPDGKTVYYSASGNLWAIPAGGGDARSLAAGDGVAADPNGQDLIVQRNEKEGVRLLRLALSARSERPIPFSSELQISADLIAAHSVSTDGRIVVAAISKDSWFYMAAVLQPKTGKVQQIPLRYAGDIFPPGWTRDGKILAPGLQMRASLWRFQKESKP